MEADFGIMNKVLEVFLNRISIGLPSIAGDARGLLGILASIEILLLSLFWSLTGEDAVPKLIRKILMVFFFIWVIDSYPNLLEVIVDGFIDTGRNAAGGVAFDINNPSGIIHAGLKVTEPILEHARAKSGILGGAFFDSLMSFVASFLILISYFILALQIFLTRIEFALLSTLGLILIPFGVFRHTAFLAEKVFGAIISFGVKFMVLGFIVSIGMPLMKELSLPEDPSWIEMFSIMFGSLSMAVLSIHAPGVASGLLNGSPSLSSTPALRTGAAIGGLTVAGAGVAARSAVAAKGVGDTVALGARESQKAVQSLQKRFRAREN